MTEIRMARFGVSLAGAIALALPTAAQADDGAPAGMVAYFTQAAEAHGNARCPSGWEEATQAQGRLILGVSDPSRSGLETGNALSNGEVPTHVHGYNGTATVPGLEDDGSAVYLDTVDGNNQQLTGTDDYPISGTTLAADLGYPFIQFLVCEKQPANSADTLPIESIAFFDTQASFDTQAGCPSNWGALNSANGFFLLPVEPIPAGQREWEIGKTVNTAWTVDPKSNPPVQEPTHDHGDIDPSVTLHSTTGSVNTYYSPPLGASNQASVNVTIEANDNTSAPILPVVTLLVCQKNSSGQTGAGSGHDLPRGMTFFYSGESCPDGTVIPPGASARFVIGISEAGSQGTSLGGSPMQPGEMSRSHSHEVHGSFSMNIDRATVVENTIDTQEAYAVDLAHEFTDRTTKEEVALPFMPLLMCQVK
ncbi:MAG: hypothetical protein ACREIP_08145 [Alphaproteobacteria bacterium]